MIKQIPKDFVVEELFSVSAHSCHHPDKKSYCDADSCGTGFLEKGTYAVFLLRKKSRNTEDVVCEIASILGIKRKMIGYAGAKDKNAETSQYISIKGVSPSRVTELEIRGACLEPAGFLNDPITLGSHSGNRFRITVRNLDKAPDLTNMASIPNYFDEQRFSVKNVEIGRSIIMKDYKKAVSALIESSPNSTQGVIAHLEKNRNDYVGALRLVQKKILMIYVHSYQSLLFNRALSIHFKSEKIPCIKLACSGEEILFPKEEVWYDDKMPLLGFGTEVKASKFSPIIDSVMKKEGLGLRDFIVREIPELSFEGSERSMFAKISDFRIEPIEDDELNTGKKKMAVEFSLPKGSYATLVIKRLFS